jgi:hypothetical protein
MKNNLMKGGNTHSNKNNSNNNNNNNNYNNKNNDNVSSTSVLLSKYQRQMKGSKSTVTTLYGQVEKRSSGE